MKEFLSKVPYPMAGLMLALASTGNLLMSYGNIYRYTFGALSTVLLTLLIAKIIVTPQSIGEGFSNPVVASVMPTFSMGLMILSTYLRVYVPNIAFIVWMLGISIHSFLIIAFTARYITKFNIKAVFPSYFVVYVGIVVGSVTAPVFNKMLVGQYIFWFGFISYLVLLPIVVYRYVKIKEIPEPASPTFIIFAAPSSLLLTGYLNSFPVKKPIVIYFLLALIIIMVTSALIKLAKLLKLQFYPSYSAFTFPFVITAIAIKGLNNYLIDIGNTITYLGLVVNILEIWAVCIVLYVLVRYVMFLLPAPFIKKAAKPNI